MRPANWAWGIGAGVVAMIVTVAAMHATAASEATQGASGAAPSSRSAPHTANAGETLRGKVTNSYRVRDDILEYINGKYQDEKTRTAFIRYAAAQQDLIEYGSTREAAIRTGDIVMTRVTCVIRVIGLDRADELKSVMVMTVDTEARFTAYWKAVDLQAGRAVDAPKGDPCA